MRNVTSSVVARGKQPNCAGTMTLQDIEIEQEEDFTPRGTEAKWKLNQ